MKSWNVIDLEILNECDSIDAGIRYVGEIL